MTSPLHFSADGILALLRSQGLRITRSRHGIVLALFKATRPLSLSEIQQQALLAVGVLPDYATVFRMMILLESLNLVHKVNLRRSCSYFELTDPSKHHDHLVCTQCGLVVRMDIPCLVDEADQRVEQEFGFRGVHHSLEFFGWCPDCAASVGAKETASVPVVAARVVLDEVAAPSALEFEVAEIVETFPVPTTDAIFPGESRPEVSESAETPVPA